MSRATIGAVETDGLWYYLEASEIHHTRVLSLFLSET